MITDTDIINRAVLKREASPAYLNSDNAPPPGDAIPEDGRRRRRISDRIRSPSDDSNSSSSGEEDDSSTRQGSAPPESQNSFQSSTAAAGPAGFAVPVRKNILSDPNRSDSSLDSPLPAHMRSRDGTPSALAGGFARPSPASRRRTASSTIHLDGDPNSPDLSNPIKRSFSSSSIRMQSSRPQNRLSSHHSSRPSSPMSAVDQIDSASSHGRTKSPDKDDCGSEAMDQIGRKAIADFGPDQMEDEEERDKRDGDDRDANGNDTVLSRLNRISVSLLPKTPESLLKQKKTESTASLHTSHDQLRRLRKENNDLLRKLKETEKSLALQG